MLVAVSALPSGREIEPGESFTGTRHTRNEADNLLMADLCGFNGLCDVVRSAGEVLCTGL